MPYIACQQGQDTARIVPTEHVVCHTPELRIQIASRFEQKGRKAQLLALLGRMGMLLCIPYSWVRLAVARALLALHAKLPY